MVDEFSAFARMPHAGVARRRMSGRVAREALILQRTAHPEIEWVTEIPGPWTDRKICDRRLLGQALTNLLLNAADAVAMRRAWAAVPGEGGEQAGAGAA